MVVFFHNVEIYGVETIKISELTEEIIDIYILFFKMSVWKLV